MGRCTCLAFLGVAGPRPHRRVVSFVANRSQPARHGLEAALRRLGAPTPALFWGASSHAPGQASRNASTMSLGLDAPGKALSHGVERGRLGRPREEHQSRGESGARLRSSAWRLQELVDALLLWG